MNQDTNITLVCPESKQELTWIKLADLEGSISKDGRFVSREKGPKPVGRTSNVLVREDLNCAYPINVKFYHAIYVNKHEREVINYLVTYHVCFFIIVGLI